MKNILLYFWYKFIALPFRIMPIKKNRIVFENFFGKGYSDSPRYIADEILKSEENDFELIWLVKDKYYKDIPNKIKQIKRGTIKELYYLSTSKFWIDNSRKHIGTTKRKKQYYIQTWHAGISLKSGEAGTIDVLSSNYIKSAVNDSKMANVFLSNSKWLTKIYRSLFWYNGEIAEIGLPREDIFFNAAEMENRRKLVAEKLNISKNTRILFYAPTFRDNGNIECYDIDFSRVVTTLEQTTTEPWCILYRLHPNIKTDIKLGFEPNKIINVSDYPDINDLILSCDFLVSDYSSCLFDGLLAKKKVLIYASDLEQYVLQRSLLFNINDLPFPFADNTSALLDNILHFNDAEYNDKVESFLTNCGFAKGGEASKNVLELIEKVLYSDGK